MMMPKNHAGRFGGQSWPSVNEQLLAKPLHVTTSDFLYEVLRRLLSLEAEIVKC